MSRGNGNGQGPTNGHPGPPERLVVLGMPGYGELTAGASRGFWRATRLPDSRVWRQYNQGSLLASNFNGLWCSALNLAHAGRDVSHFAMQHADVEPEDWWLDTLIAEMEAHGLDVLGAVVPIKDPHGRTSIALDHPTGNTYRTLCRLTMNEVFRLPETFTSEDVGHPILLNTGLWVCRFDEAWARKVKFEINDRIVFDRNLDRYVPECEPEDWQFSRLCHELGLKIGATRKIKLNHRGPSPFSNGHPWGEPFDSAGVKESVLPKADRDGFAFPFDVEGWLTPAEGKELARIAAGKRVLEVGSYCGLSTICMARTAKDLSVSVDPHDGRGTAVPRDTLRFAPGEPGALRRDREGGRPRGPRRRRADDPSYGLPLRPHLHRRRPRPRLRRVRHRPRPAAARPRRPARVPRLPLARRPRRRRGGGRADRFGRRTPLPDRLPGRGPTPGLRPLTLAPGGLNHGRSHHAPRRPADDRLHPGRRQRGRRDRSSWPAT
jgi:hypothetical protein